LPNQLFYTDLQLLKVNQNKPTGINNFLIYQPKNQMKHLFLFFILSGLLTVAMAQESDSISLTKDKVVVHSPSNIALWNQADSLKKMQYQLDYVRHCLNKCHSEKTRGYLLSFMGGVIMGLSTGITNTDVNHNGQQTRDFTTEGELMLIGGLGMSLLGTIMIIDSEKWLRRAYLGPDGLGIKIKF